MKTVFSAIKSSNIPKEVKDFLEFTFNIIEEGKPHKLLQLSHLAEKTSFLACLQQY
jgi:hypothetical protein